MIRTSFPNARFMTIGIASDAERNDPTSQYIQCISNVKDIILQYKQVCQRNIAFNGHMYAQFLDATLSILHSTQMVSPLTHMEQIITATCQTNAEKKLKEYKSLTTILPTDDVL
jgi:hypothetical protein